MKQFYNIKHQLKTKETGAYTQVSSLSNTDIERIMKKETPKNNLLFGLNKNAKLTDVLSEGNINARGLLISNKLKELIISFKPKNNYVFYPAIIIDNNENEHLYHYLHITHNNIEYINYTESEFYSTEFEMREEKINLNSHEDYLNEKNKNNKFWGVEAEKIKLNTSLLKDELFYSFYPFDFNIYITDNFVKYLKENNLKGIELKKALNIY